MTDPPGQPAGLPDPPAGSPGDESAGVPQVLYRERLGAPAIWWVVAVVLVATLAFAVGYPLGLPAGAVTLVLAGGATAWVPRSAAALGGGHHGAPHGGRAWLPLSAAGTATALDDAAAAALRGTGADARAYLLLRPWVSGAVRVDVDDPDDPAPYWYVSTRHPDALARALAVAGRTPDVPQRPDGAG